MIATPPTKRARLLVMEIIKQSKHRVVSEKRLLPTYTFKIKSTVMCHRMRNKQTAKEHLRSNVITIEQDR